MRYVPPGGFGWLLSPDVRDMDHPMEAHVDPLAAEPPYIFWPCRQALNQGPVGCCVGASCRGWLEARPRPVRIGESWTFRQIYDWAQLHDGFPGQEPEMSGTSLRAGMQALQAAGEVSSYVWAQTFAAAKLFLQQHGPIIFGTSWYTGMMQPDASNVIHATGSVEGGHAYLVQGWSAARRQYRILQSWGTSWGVNGRCWIGEDDLMKLYSQGECVTAIEVGG
jgi:hypothetical protein